MCLLDEHWVVFYSLQSTFTGYLSPLVLTEILWGDLDDSADEEIKTEKARPHSLLVMQGVLKPGSTYI